MVGAPTAAVKPLSAQPPVNSPSVVKPVSAAEALRITAEDLKRLALIDVVVPEPMGGAHRAPAEAMEAVRTALAAALAPLVGLDGATLRSRRRDKFLNMGREALV